MGAAYLIYICALCFSPIITGPYLNNNRLLLYRGLIKVFLLFSVASFIGYFFGINFFVYHGELLDLEDAGHFSGFTNQSMVLGPIASISSIYCLTRLLTLHSSEKKSLLVWGLLSISSIGSVMLSASRSALLGAIAAFIVTLFVFFKGRLSRFIRYIAIIIVLLCLSFPLWRSLTKGVIEKNEVNVSQGSAMYSRQQKMGARIYEIRKSPILGIGFSAVDPSVDEVDKVNGVIEPGSSWLCVFSMSGILGFIVFVYINIASLRAAYTRIENKKAAALLLGILTFFFIHMMVEGYVFAGGSLLCAFYWLTHGAIFAMRK